MLNSLLSFAQFLLPLSFLSPLIEPPKPIEHSFKEEAFSLAKAHQIQGESTSSLSEQKTAQAPTRTQEELERVVTEMQKVYEKTTSFSAKYTQRFTYTLLRRTQESSGTVQFKKPGFMRWDYTAPKKKSFIVDGKALWIDTPEDHTAMVNHCFKNDGLTASVSFLWGSGNFLKEFDVTWFAGKFGKASDYHLALTPKKSNSVYQKLILVLDAKTYRVQQSIVVDTQKNVNQFIFSKLVFNKGVSQKSFQYIPAKGTHVALIPGTCPAPNPAH